MKSRKLLREMNNDDTPILFPHLLFLHRDRLDVETWPPERGVYGGGGDGLRRQEFTVFFVTSNVEDTETIV